MTIRADTSKFPQYRRIRDRQYHIVTLINLLGVASLIASQPNFLRTLLLSLVLSANSESGCWLLANSQSIPDRPGPQREQGKKRVWMQGG
jgi:hypothetical protein